MISKGMVYMKRIAGLLILAVFVFMLTACNKKDRLLGNWELIATNSYASRSLDLSNDGSCVFLDVFDPHNGTDEVLEYGCWILEDDYVYFAGPDGLPLVEHPNMRGRISFEKNNGECGFNPALYTKIVYIVSDDGEFWEYAIAPNGSLMYDAGTRTIDNRPG